MITQTDLDAAIAECQGKRNPDASTCIKLAAFYTIRRELFGEEKEAEQYSHSPAPSYAPAIEIDSNSEFARIVNGREMPDILPQIDELVDTLRIIQPRLYRAFIDKIS